MIHSSHALDSGPDEERRKVVAKYKRGREDGASIDLWEDPEFEIYHITDRYGFIHNQTLPSQPSSLQLKVQRLEQTRNQKWLKMIRKWDHHFPSDKVTKRVFKGIPEPVRGLTWALILDLPRIRKEQVGIYERMCEYACQWSPDIRQIDLDVNRTYRNHLMFRKRYDVKQQALFHILAAYSVYNTEVGYCQGMSQIAALLLMYLNEEDAFWGLSQLMSSKHHSMHGLFIPGFPKLLRFQRHHDRILQKLLPQVKNHLDRMGIFVSLYTIKWFMQCFLDRVPFSLTLRLWDIYILEGEKLLVAMGYNILKIHQKQILQLETEELMNFFQSRLEKNFGFEDNQAIDSLVSCMNELRRLKLDLPAPPATDAAEQPAKPFGLFVPPSAEPVAGRNTLMAEHEHGHLSKRRAWMRESRVSISIPPDGGPECVEEEEEEEGGTEGGAGPAIRNSRPTDLNLAKRRAEFSRKRLETIENDSPAEEPGKSMSNGSPVVVVETTGVSGT